MMYLVSFCDVFFQRDVLDEIWDLIESVLRDFLPTLTFILRKYLSKGAFKPITLAIIVRLKIMMGLCHQAYLFTKTGLAFVPFSNAITRPVNVRRQAKIYGVPIISRIFIGHHTVIWFPLVSIS